ncbi:hypothetical protein HKD37_13G035846 [Glycine soja]
MNHFFRKVPGRGFPGVFRKKCSSGRRLVTSGRTLLPETFRKRFFRNFRKTPSSAISPFFPTSPALVFYPTVPLT